MRRRSAFVAFALALVGGAASCGGGAAPSAPGPKVKPRAAASGEAFGLPRTWPPSRIVPDVDLSRKVELETPEGELRLVGRIRVRTRPDGVVERADDLLPAGRVASLRLPSRLGGGFLFVGSTGRGTELWRTPTWLDKLVPLTSIGPAADMDRPFVVGFDRVYLRLASSELLAIDPKSGAPLGLGTLPPSPSYGEMIFLDGWRAVVEADISGPMVTFDAGATWRRLGVAGRVRSIAPTEPDPDDGGAAIVAIEGGYYVVDARGDVAFFRGPPPQAPPVAGATIAFATPPGVSAPAAAPDVDPDASAPKPGPLGKKPLRTALELGFPDSDRTALVAKDGDLFRVALASGAIVARREDAYPDPHASCHAIALAAGDLGRPVPPEQEIGFVCGEPGGATSIYALDPPLAMRQVLRFASPRVVLESGQGAIVVRGPCGDDPAPSGVRPFCVRFVDGSTREVRVRGDVGAERVVALADGRVAILVPPRPGTQGQLSILDGSASRHVPLKVPDGAPREVETGMWLEGFQQVSKDAVGGWIEAGGPTFGVRVGLDGAVTVGEVVDERNGVLTAGRFGLAIGDGGRLLETTDMGLSWKEVSLPGGPAEGAPGGSHRCSAVGCALDGWLRVGWGDPAREGDLRDAPAPEPQKLSTFRLSGAPLSLACSRGRSEPKPKGAGKKNEGEMMTAWLPFRGVEPPAMQKGDVGYDGGAPFDAIPVRAYAWGPRDADWSRTGRMVIRFEDKFSLDAVRSSAISASAWGTEQAAADAMGSGGWGITWSAFRDPAGDAALVGSCRGRLCALFAVEAGQPVLPLRTTDPNGLVRPLPGSAVRLEKAWFYLGDEGTNERVGLYRAELGRVRQVALLPRPVHRRGAPPAPRLVRRAKGRGLGILFVQREGPFDKRGARYVLPLDPETGQPGDPIPLGRPDLGDVAVTAPCAGQDGWLIDVGSLESTPIATVGDAAVSIEGFDARMRLEEGSACIEAAAATLIELGSQPSGFKPAGGGKAKESSPFAVFATDRSSGARTELLCRLAANP